jgi:hypothetical protein
MGILVDRGYDLETAKGVALVELDVWYGGAVLDTFDCNVLGPMHRYYCSESDQLRMINGKVSNVSMTLMCGTVPTEPDTDPTYEWKEHTSTECGKVHTAYVTFSRDASAQYASWKSRINSATSTAAVETVMAEYLE